MAKRKSKKRSLLTVLNAALSVLQELSDDHGVNLDNAPDVASTMKAVEAEKKKLKERKVPMSASSG